MTNKNPRNAGRHKLPDTEKKVMKAITLSPDIIAALRSEPNASQYIEQLIRQDKNL